MSHPSPRLTHATPLSPAQLVQVFLEPSKVVSQPPEPAIGFESWVRRADGPQALREFAGRRLVPALDNQVEKLQCLLWKSIAESCLV